MAEYNNKSIGDFECIIGKNIEECIKLKLVYHIKINFQTYNIIKEYYVKEGIFVLIDNNINKKILGIVPTKTESIYGKQFFHKDKYLYTFDEIYEIRDFTDNVHHFIYDHFNPKKEIPKNKPHIFCDEQGGIIVYNYHIMDLSGFYNNIIPKEKRTKENLLNNYYIIFQSFYDCAKNASDEYCSLTNQEAIINFLVNL